jgi:hypothetical protein
MDTTAPTRSSVLAQLPSATPAASRQHLREPPGGAHQEGDADQEPAEHQDPLVHIAVGHRRHAAQCGVEDERDADDEKRGRVVQADERREHGRAADDLRRQNGEGGQRERDRRDGPEPRLVPRLQILGERGLLQRVDLVDGDVGEGNERERLEGDVPHRGVAVAIRHGHRAHRIAGADVGRRHGAPDDPDAPGAAAVVVVRVALDLEVEVEAEGEHRQGVGDDDGEVERMGGSSRKLKVQQCGVDS